MSSPRRLAALVAAAFAFAGLATPAPVFAQPKPAAASAAKESEEPVIPGVVLNRPDGRFLGVEAEGMSLKVTFYDAEKKPEPADAIRITARWSDNKPRRTVLLPSSAETLVSPPHLSRPFNYIVYIALVGADEQVKESYSVRPE